MVTMNRIVRIFIIHALCTTNHAIEVINNFTSAITVNTDGSMNVHETITYTNRGKYDLHGIRRQFPLRYRGPYGTNYTIVFSVKKITRDGESVPYAIEYTWGHTDAVIYIGSPEKTIPPGTYTYTINYRTDRQLGFFETHDELYWNVTGNEWDFPIEKATATITLPKTVPPTSMKTQVFTGFYGEQEKKFIRSQDNQTVHVNTTAPLRPGEGLTVSVQWPKRHVKEPTAWDEFYYFMQDNGPLILIFISFLVVILWYIYAYFRVRKEERRIVVIPRFHPPRKVSPGEASYILRMHFEPKQCAAEIVNLGVNGLLTIEQKKQWIGSYYIISRTDAAENIANEHVYADLLPLLFSRTQTVPLTDRSAKIINKVTHHLEISYSKKYRHLFIQNYQRSMLPAGILLATCIGAFAWQPFAPITFATAFIGIFLTFVIGIIVMRALRSYTEDGNKLRAEIEGFKLFLEGTEKERIRIIGTPPTKTPELYEQYLPYAIALGVEEQWSKQFAPVFKKLVTQGAAYVPLWYDGHITQFNSQGFTTSIQRSIQSAAKTSGIGSSTGGGGGGFSGGGRGGGGGGSW